MKRRTWIVTAVAAAAVAAVPAIAPARGGKGTGGKPATITPIADGLAGPLQLAVRRNGTVYVAQSFAGLLTKLDGSNREDVVSIKDAEIAGVSIAKRGHGVYYTVSAGGPGIPPVANLSLLRHGKSTVVADLLAYETTNNPDQGNTYGFVGITPECAASLPPEIGPPTYTGGIDSHPYATASTKRGVYVADAAGNAILKVSRHGKVSTVAVLPPQPLTVTAELAAGQKLPPCTIGLTYNFEPVPTDVEVGKHGWLYVTTLPGGPEDPTFPARGAVWKINPHTGAATQLAGGLAGATNLALGEHGTIYVTEIFGGRVSKIRHGKVSTLIELPSPAAIEYAEDKLYVGYDINGDPALPPTGKVGVITR